MDKIKVIQHARSYMDKLSKGIDPISGMDSTSLLQQEQLRKCFAFVSDILGEVIDNNGLVNLPEVTGHNYEIVRKKAAFSLNPQQKARVWLSENPLSPNSFVKNINAVINENDTEKLSVTAINGWLREKGLMAETHVPTVINKNVKIATSLSGRIGIVEEAVIDKNTGEAKRQLLFTKQAQQFILDNLDEIIKYGKE